MPSEYLKTRVSYENRYRLTRIYLDDYVSPGRRRYGTWVPPEIDMTEYDVHTVTSVELQRMDLISYKWYRDPTFWWAIALVNNISDPLGGLSAGQVLLIPKLSAIIAAFRGVVTQ